MTTSNSGLEPLIVPHFEILTKVYFKRTYSGGGGGVNILLLSYSIYGLTTSLFKLQLSLWLQLTIAISLCGNYEAASVNLP